jgi:O-acetyl-ADP-ribose deacetylase (regulator of RNase III)
MRKTINGATIELIRGDLTRMTTDAIVNAANEQLAHGGGVAGAIVSRGGSSIQKESDAWVSEHGPVVTGTAAITGAGTLEAKYVIHAVGPVMGQGDEDALLASATRAALQRAEDAGLKSIAFPAISTGVFGYPVERCAQVMLDTIVETLASGSTLNHVVICLWTRNDLKDFESYLTRLSQPEGE